MSDGKDQNGVIFDYTDSFGSRYHLTLFKETYLLGNGTSIGIVGNSEASDVISFWWSLTKNLPQASSWCAEAENIVIDSDYTPPDLIDALVSSGIITLTGGSCRSGRRTYPLAKVAPLAMEGMAESYGEACQRLAASLAATQRDGAVRGVSLKGEAEASRQAADRLSGDAGSPAHEDMKEEPR